VTRRLAALAAALADGVAGVTVANAATLGVNGGSVTTVQAGPCSTATLTLTRTGQFLFWHSGIRISNIPEACRNIPILLSSNDGSVTGSVPAGATSGSVDIATAWYWSNIRDYSVVFDGWHVPASRAA
jgi:hypothetical protein